jgi:hypothetical protein
MKIAFQQQYQIGKGGNFRFSVSNFALLVLFLLDSRADIQFELLFTDDMDPPGNL